MWHIGEIRIVRDIETCRHFYERSCLKRSISDRFNYCWLLIGINIHLVISLMYLFRFWRWCLVPLGCKMNFSQGCAWWRVTCYLVLLGIIMALGRSCYHKIDLCICSCIHHLTLFWQYIRSGTLYGRVTLAVHLHFDLGCN